MKEEQKVNSRFKKRLDKELDKIEEMINCQNEKIEKLGEKIIDLDGIVRDRLEEYKRFYRKLQYPYF